MSTSAGQNRYPSPELLHSDLEILRERAVVAATLEVESGAAKQEESNAGEAAQDDDHQQRHRLHLLLHEALAANHNLSRCPNSQPLLRQAALNEASVRYLLCDAS